MYRLLISFNQDEFSSQVWNKPVEYLLRDEVEVCKVISRLSHLKPIITLCHVSVLSADEVLKDFELKEV